MPYVCATFIVGCLHLCPCRGRRGTDGWAPGHGTRGLFGAASLPSIRISLRIGRTSLLSGQSNQLNDPANEMTAVHSLLVQDVGSVTSQRGMVRFPHLPETLALELP